MVKTTGTNHDVLNPNRSARSAEYSQRKGIEMAGLQNEGLNNFVSKF